MNCNLSIAFEAKAFDLIPLNFSTKLTIGGISGLDRNFAKIIPTAEQKIADEG